MSAFRRLCEIVIRILDPLEPMRTLCYSQSLSGLIGFAVYCRRGVPSYQDDRYLP